MSEQIISTLLVFVVVAQHLLSFCFPPLGIDYVLARSSPSHVGDGAVGGSCSRWKFQRIKVVNIRLLLEAFEETVCGDQVDGRGMKKEGEIMKGGPKTSRLEIKDVDVEGLLSIICRRQIAKIPHNQFISCPSCRLPVTFYNSPSSQAAKGSVRSYAGIQNPLMGNNGLQGIDRCCG